MEPRASLGWLGVGLGAIAFGSGLLHQIGVTVVAFNQRGAYDLRLGTLLALGFGVLLAGSLMIAGGWRLVHAREAGFLLAFPGAFTMFLLSASPTPVAEGFWIGLVLYGPYWIALLIWARP